MSDISDYRQKLSEAVNARRDWIEKDVLSNLKENLRVFQSSYTSLYSAFIKKGLVHEDPYKQEIKLSDIQVPDTGDFPENEKDEKMCIRLSNFDSQLDFLVNFYSFSADYLTLERIKKILALVKYIDWVHLGYNSSSINTRYVTEFCMQVKAGLDPLSLVLINESISALIRQTSAIMGNLKVLTDFNKEAYKLAVRVNITSKLPEAPAPTLEQIKKQFPNAMSRQPFYNELIDEILKEDYGTNKVALREAVLRTLRIEEKKPKEKMPIEPKVFLLDGIQLLGGLATILIEIIGKLDENEQLLLNKKLSFGEKLRRFFQQAFNRMPDEVIYELEYTESGAHIKEKVNFTEFRDSVNKRIKSLSQISPSTGGSLEKFEALAEDQLVAFLERNVKDIKALHRELDALDNYFKAHVASEDRSRVKGIKPELSAIKNIYIKANQKAYDYGAQKEEAEQFKKLGIIPK